MAVAAAKSPNLKSRISEIPKSLNPHFERDIRGKVMIPAHARPAHHRLRQKLADIAAWNETCALNRVCRGQRSQTGDHHLRHHVHARPRGRPGGRRVEAGTDVPFAIGVDTPVRRRRRSVHGRRGRRSVPLRAALRGRHSRSSRSRKCTASASSTWRGCGESWPTTLRPSRLRCRASRRRCARAARIAQLSSCSRSSIASSRATSAATRSARCRRSRRWIRSCAWGRASASAWGCGTCCPRPRPGGSSA